ncbi:hypothetical protein DdX_07227 [Ditylenchus destructor]|uniref:MARVEL domain-containing protein n=1 Tax=Ditylenchus destructor TaxID=166010 RepID=A0AAD4R861_9BILA|nr:hypothetical protein DdX_07227 [Ditylenchus destructor]
MAVINTAYLTTNRGIIKILQIVIGFIICSLLCGNWYGGKTCFGEGRLGYASGLNFVIVIVNIVLLILNFVDLSIFSLERTYSVVSTVLFLIASLMMIWFVIDTNFHSTHIISTVLIVTQFVLFLWDVKILQGEAPN